MTQKFKEKCFNGITISQRKKANKKREREREKEVEMKYFLAVKDFVSFNLNLFISTYSFN